MVFYIFVNHIGVSLVGFLFFSWICAYLPGPFIAAILGPFFPRRHPKVALSKSIARPSVPDLNMHLHPSYLEAPKVSEVEMVSEFLDNF